MTCSGQIPVLNLAFSDKLRTLPPHALDTAFETLRRDFDAAGLHAAARARAELLQTLNQLFRRFRTYQTENDWVQTLLDAAAPFARQILVFSVDGSTLRLRGQLPAGQISPDLAFPIAIAGAFASTIDLKDPVTALRTPGEVSPALSDGHAHERAHIFPIVNGDRVSAVLFASENGSDMNALELVTGIASTVLDRKANVALHAQIAPVVNLPQPAKPPAETKPAAWTDLPQDQRQLHIRAQRFARVALAEIQLARPEACRAGREQGDLYLFLKREIDKARESYRKQFMTVPSMVDYLHLELIQNAVDGDEQKLGVDYPGRLQ